MGVVSWDSFYRAFMLGYVAAVPLNNIGVGYGAHNSAARKVFNIFLRAAVFKHAM